MLSQTNRELLNHPMHIVNINDMTNNQPCQPVGGGSPPDIMPCRDGTESARIIVEASRVVDACRFHYLVEVACHAIQAVEEPPGWTEFQCGVVTCQCGEFAGIGCLIEREQDQCETRV